MEEISLSPSMDIEYGQMNSAACFKQQEMVDLGEYYYKTVLRNLEDYEVRNYITSQAWKQKLGYPLQCLTNSKNDLADRSLVGIAYSITPLLFKFVLSNSQSLLFEYQIQANEQKQGPRYQFDAELIQRMAKLIKGNILVGHDLGAFLAHTHILHLDFIDTQALYPHHFGLPFRNTIQNIALIQLQLTIYPTPSNLHQQAEILLKIVKRHIQMGRGTQENIKAKKLVIQSNTTFLDIIKQAELQPEKLAGFFLRGSRAFGWQIQNEHYQSDWDFFCVYQSKTQINGKLIKLWNTDITIYDCVSFDQLMRINDISLLELFFIPPQFQYVNRVKYPEINFGLLRKSLEHHWGKCDRKLKRYWRDYKGEKRDWKMLKVQHYKARFVLYFIQLFINKSIDFTPITAIWHQAAQMYQQTRKYSLVEQFLAKELTKVQQHLKQIESTNKGIELRPQRVKYNKINHQQIHYPHNHTLQNGNTLQLALQHELQHHGLARLQSFKITINRHKTHNNLIQFHYSQASDFRLPICRQARGIILDQQNNYSIVCLPYFKFFDHNDSRHSQVKFFNFNSFKIYEKFDGSIASLYEYAGRWYVSSSRVPEGSNNYCFAQPQTTTTFEKQFWKIFNQKSYTLPTLEHRDKTFVFQLQSKDHIIVVHRNESSLVLHGVRDKVTGKQQEVHLYGQKYGWQYAQPVHPHKSLEELVELSGQMNPLQQQGFVLCDDKYLRMKVKSPAYVKANWLAELNLSPDKNPRKYLLQIVLSGEGQLFKQYCPEWAATITEFTTKTQRLNTFCWQFYFQNKALGKKQVAEVIKLQKKQLQCFLYAICGMVEKWSGCVQQLLTVKKLLMVLDSME